MNRQGAENAKIFKKNLRVHGGLAVQILPPGCEGKARTHWNDRITERMN